VKKSILTIIKRFFKRTNRIDEENDLIKGQDSKLYLMDYFMKEQIRKQKQWNQNI
jgi:hypothetical protein